MLLTRVYIHTQMCRVSPLYIYSEVYCTIASLTSTVLWCCVLFASGVVMEGDGSNPFLYTSELVLAVE